jgi:hypothetical protein
LPYANGGNKVIDCVDASESVANGGRIANITDLEFDVRIEIGRTFRIRTVNLRREVVENANAAPLP